MTDTWTMESLAFDGVVLAGGRGSRLGGVDKAALELNGKRMVDRALQAARQTGAQRLIAVGPPHVGISADCVVREDPPFSGPLAALDASLREVRAPWVLLLACDLVHPAAIALRLNAELGASVGDFDGVLLVDETGRRQWLAGCYRSDALRAAIRALDSTQGKPLAAAIGGLRLREIHVRAPNEKHDGSDVDVSDIDVSDIDTSEQLAQARSGTRKVT